LPEFEPKTVRAFANCASPEIQTCGKQMPAASACAFVYGSDRYNPVTRWELCGLSRAYAWWHCGHLPTSYAYGIRGPCSADVSWADRFETLEYTSLRCWV